MRVNKYLRTFKECAGVPISFPTLGRRRCEFQQQAPFYVFTETSRRADHRVEAQGEALESTL